LETLLLPTAPFENLFQVGNAASPGCLIRISIPGWKRCLSGILARNYVD